MKYLGSQSCYDRVEQAFEQLDHLMSTRQSDVLKTKLNCPAISTDIENDNDAYTLHEFVFESFAGLVQYQRYTIDNSYYLID